MTNVLLRGLSITGLLLAVACATPPKADLPADANAQSELQKLNADIEAAQEKQYDRLSPRNFERAISYRNDADKKIQKGKPSDKVLSDIAVSKAAVEDVMRVGAANASSVQPVLDARQHAMEANAHKIKDKAFRDADEDFADLGQDMEKGKFKVDARTFSKLEKEYQDLEVEARRVTLIGEAQQSVQRAEKQGAVRKVPRTYQVAKADLTSAERAIAASPHAPEGYNTAVARANASAAKLAEVADTAHSKDVSEEVALTLWNQKQALRASQADLISAQAQAKNAEAAAQEKQTSLQSELAMREAALTAEQRRLAAEKATNKEYADQEGLRKKFEEVRGQFTADEADVVRDGNKIIVRLKKMNFTSGRSEVSPDSYATLKKVQSLIAAVPAEQVRVEGHTDSIGTNKVNQGLSEKRAEAVKQYLASQGLSDQVKLDAKGYGSERPLMTNKTKQGRATNRRVDVVIETSTAL